MKFFTKWTTDQSRIPVDPETRVKGWLIIMEMCKSDLSSGQFTDWGTTPDATEGYLISDMKDMDELVRTSGNYHKYMPYIISDTKPVLNVQQAIGIIQYIITSFGASAQSEAKK